jgi:peptide/nickel transport system substrate-binding protein
LLREAFLLTVPREQIVRELVTPIDPDAAVRESLVVRDGEGSYRQSIAAAAALIARAGATAPPVCILFDPSNPRRVTEFELVKQSAEKAGFVVSNCSTSDWQGFLGVDGAYDAALFAWDESSTAVTATQARLRSNSTVSNFSHYSSPAVDLLLDRLALEDDEDQQRALLEQVNDELMADSYGLPLYDYPSVVAYRGTIENVSLSPLAGLLWNVWEWQPAAKAE